ncbi:DUF2851 family protein [Flavobacterium sp. J372]|uniref:DUF2851 family protein n=1 Tax=Flavobacterium sp. J372 TaxID=2898436 RepID=UPI0021507539|nr:DUF2851 family protein [Flavobacterium sp. J372]MCR5863229.1 DUF2851 family protein [Flavobacterium sp. J372]
MKEDFLHHVWQYKKFNPVGLKTVQGEEVTIISSGQYLQQAGPDFFNAQIVIDGQRWAGNVEIHIKSSDWYLHHHESDSNYDSVILHVVWEHDVDVYHRGNSAIPVLELKDYVSAETLGAYQLLSSSKTWINCENRLEDIDSFIFSSWKERLFFERLERKSFPIAQLASATNNDWEAVLFCFLAKNFGLNTNGSIFLAIAQSLPFSVIRKESFDVYNLEALLFGRAGLLDDNKEDIYFKDLKDRWEYLKHKHRLTDVHIDPVQFFKHRPDNFPTIRLAQLAQLYHKNQNLFSQLIDKRISVVELYNIFAVAVSEYWQTHYQFDRESPKKQKALARQFIDLIIINTIVPFRFAYAKATGKESGEALIELLEKIAPESNSIIEKFGKHKIAALSAYDTQALLQLKNEYCEHKRCLQCAVGTELMKG